MTVATRPRSDVASPAETKPGELTALLELAVKQNVPVETIEKLVALHERVSDRAAAQEFALAVAAFQAECPPIAKRSTAEIVTKSGGKYRYAYAELDEIARTVNPILSKHGLAYSWNSAVTEDSRRMKVLCRLRHVGGHSETATFELPIDNPSAMSDQQKNGAALTFGRRQSLIAILGLTTADPDTDGAAAREADPTPISDDQALHLEELLGESGADAGQFLKYMGVQGIAQIRAADYPRAEKALRAAIRRKGAK